MGASISTPSKPQSRRILKRSRTEFPGAIMPYMTALRRRRVLGVGAGGWAGRMVAAAARAVVARKVRRCIGGV